MNTKVYITNKSVHDFSDASKYGDFVYLSKGSVNRYSTSRMYRMFHDILKSSHREDFLLPTSLSTMNMIAACIFAMKHRRLNLLLFKDGRYVKRTILFDEADSLSSIEDLIIDNNARALLGGD